MTRVPKVATFALYLEVTYYGQLTQAIRDFECSTQAFQVGAAMRLAFVVTHKYHPGRDVKLLVPSEARVQNLEAKSDSLADQFSTSLAF